MVTTKCVHVHVAGNGETLDIRQTTSVLPETRELSWLLLINMCTDVMFLKSCQSCLCFLEMWRYYIANGCMLPASWSVPAALSAAGNWSLESVRQLWERCEPRSLVTIHRCGTLTGWWWQPSRAKVRACMCACVSPAWRQKFVNGCGDCRHTWDSSRFQTTSDKTGGSERLSAKAVRSATGTGAKFHKIKAPLFRETCCFTAMIYGEYLEAAGHANVQKAF